MKPVFVKFSCIMNDANHTVKEIYQRLDTVMSFTLPTSEHVKLGAGCQIDLSNGGCLLTVEPLEEVEKLISRASLEQARD